MRKLLTSILALALIFGVALEAPAAAKKPKKKMAEPKKKIGEKPDITLLEPRGIQRGVETKIKLVGTNFLGLTELKLGNKKLTGALDADADEKLTEAWIKVKAASDLPRGPYEISVVNEKGESAKVKLYVDDLPQVSEAKKSKMPKPQQVSLPVDFWGTLNPMGDSDEIEFQARAGQKLVLDVAAKSIGSKAEVSIALLDANGNELASNKGFDGGDAFAACTISTSGRYRVRISDANANGSTEHFYRLSVGELPVVIGIFPLSLRTNAESEVQLIGFNLGAKTKVKIHPAKAGDLDVPIDAEKFRPRRSFKVMVVETAELVESEPNDLPAQANSIPVPGAISGRIWASQKNEGNDADLFRFEAKAGQVLMIETSAAKRGSPVDTKVEVLHPDGKPVERLQLQAVRNSAITFKEIDSASAAARVENWQEMELNQLLYMQGEVCKIFRMPEGPDSGFQFYQSAGKRRDYLDTSGTAHALDEICYIVEPHPPGEKLVANGLPVFPLYYVNDDDPERELGSDSRLRFTAPADGAYLIRVTDNRGHSGERFAYRLSVHEARPDFTVKMGGGNPTVSPGSGQEFTLTADRVDGFDEPIAVEISNLPAGFSCSTPIVIQAGHLTANGTINAETNAMAPKAEDIAKIKTTASAMLNGEKVVKPVKGFSEIKLGEKPTLLVAFEPYVESQTNLIHHTIKDPPMEITIAPGQIIPVWLKVERHGHGELVTFTAENLPHGVIVDNIGLNGVLIPKDENRRQIFLKAAKWVPETDRLGYVQAKQAGNPTSLPVMIHVRKSHAEKSTTAAR